jgi:hypothetical protein
VTESSKCRPNLPGQSLWDRIHLTRIASQPKPKVWEVVPEEKNPPPGRSPYWRKRPASSAARNCTRPAPRRATQSASRHIGPCRMFSMSSRYFHILPGPGWRALSVFGNLGAIQIWAPIANEDIRRKCLRDLIWLRGAEAIGRSGSLLASPNDVAGQRHRDAAGPDGEGVQDRKPV